MLYSTIIAIIIILTTFAGSLMADGTADGAEVFDTAAVIVVDDTTAVTAVDDTADGAAIDDTTAITADGDTATATTVKDTAVNDSIAAAAVRATADSLRKSRRAERAAPYGVTPPDSADRIDGRSLDRAQMFRSDGVSVSEAMRYRALTSVYVPFTLSSSMNRLLHYGNTAHGWHPASAAAPTLPFFYSPRGMHGSDLLTASQASDIALDPLYGFLYAPYPDAQLMPELHIFWENGPFSQNTLNLRISRPLSPNIMLSVFSDYNYLAGTRFNHERNDIVNFYNFFRPDTSTIMNHGYNPLTEEHILGGAVLWSGADSSKFRAAFTYAGLQNEYALDIPADSFKLHRLNWARLDRDIVRLDAALLDKKIGPLRLNFKTALITETVASVYEPNPDIANGSGGANTFLADADVRLPFNAGVRLQGIAGTVESFDGEEIRYTEYYPEIFYRGNLLPPKHPLGSLDVNAYIGLGIIPQYDGDTIFLSVPYGASLDYRPTGKSRVSLYAKRDHHPAIGAEGQIESRYAGLLIGYQRTDTVNSRGAWPEGAPPYAQPGNTFIIAPWTARFGGFSLLSRTIIADEKPYIKASVKLSHSIIPREMAHSFETELGFDYWSRRDPVTFAGITDYNWNDPILDVNLKITAHIRSFRLFYKIDNLLNMRQAYVPGYFSPGLTFRWGINWFLM